MNIITNYSHVSIVTTNPATDSVTRDSSIRPVVPPVAATSATNSAATNDKEKPQSTASVIPSPNPTYEQPQNDAEINDQQASDQDSSQEQDGENASNDSNSESNERSDNSEQFTEQEQQEIEELKSRDTEVVTHELAHAAVGGQYAGAPSYSYETGPDGVKYAVSGEVSIDTSAIPGDPQATLIKAQQIKRAALAPAQPSSQDRVVAATAEQLANEARRELAVENSGNADDSTEGSNSFRLNNSIESESFNERSALAQNEEFQQTLVNRSQHINNFYQQSSQANESSSFQQQI